MKSFLEQSRTFERRVTDYFHIINTARTGTRLLADEVLKIVNAGLDDKAIEALIERPTGATGQNLRAHALREQEKKDSDLAEMWLFAVFARYESWAESLSGELLVRNAKKICQFPDSFPGSIGTTSSSSALQVIYGDTFRKDKRYLGGDEGIRDALRMYRYYKEIRNGLIHADGRASEELAIGSQDARGSWERLKENICWRGTRIPVVQKGDFIGVDFTLVQDTIALLQKLVFNIDARLLMGSIGEQEVVRRWKSHHGNKPLFVSEKVLQRGPWYQAQVSNTLSLPSPQHAKFPKRTWAAPERKHFLQFATENQLIRVRVGG